MKFIKWNKDFIIKLFSKQWVNGEFRALQIIPNWYIGIIYLKREDICSKKE